MKSKYFLIIFLIILIANVKAEIIPLKELDPDSLNEKIKQDIKSIEIYRKGLLSITEFVKSKPDIFPVEKLSENKMLRREEKEIVWNMWKSLLDYYLALDSLEQYYEDFYKIEQKDANKNSFKAFYVSFLTQYRFSLEFIEIFENNPVFNTILNEPVPELGLPERTYEKFKFHFLNVAIATKFTASDIIYKSFGQGSSPGIEKYIEEDEKFILRKAKGTGELLTLKNAFDIAGKAGFKAWFPIQAGVSNWMGDTKVKRVGRYLISQEQIKEMVPDLKPGDILFERREWYLSNIGLPGFWSHMALYIGTPDERRKFFNEPEIMGWIKQQVNTGGDIETLLQTKYPEVYALSIKEQEEGHYSRVIEAIGEGVSFTTIEHSAYADSFAVVRPKLNKKEIAIALMRAFHYSGRPYDFNFDFLTDDTLVCSELVYKCYEKSEGNKGISFPLTSLMGHTVSSPNDIAKQFSEESGTEKEQMDFVLFYDGYEKENKAVKSTLEEFRKSWKRPKWHVIVQKAPVEKQDK